MKYFVLFVAAIILIFVSNECIADNRVSGHTGNELIESCNSTNQTISNPAWGYCVGYVNGVIVGFSNGSLSSVVNAVGTYLIKLKDGQLLEQSTITYCIPPTVTREQIARVISKYLEDNPQSLNKPDGKLVIDAVSTAWPCHKPGLSSIPVPQKKRH